MNPVFIKNINLSMDHKKTGGTMKDNKNLLTGKVAVITGAGRVIGRNN